VSTANFQKQFDERQSCYIVAGDWNAIINESNYMEQSTFWYANRFSVNQEIPHILWNLKFYYGFHNSRHLSLLWARLIQSMPLSNFSKIYFNIVLPSIRGFQIGLFHWSFLIKTLYATRLSPIRSTCLAHLILLYSIIRRTLGEEYRSLSSSLCSLLHSPVTSSLLDPNILLSTLFSNTYLTFWI
jgi:hypothetical protein